MSEERMKRVAEMIAVFARTIGTPQPGYLVEEDTIWLIKRYCEEYEQLANMEEE